MTPPKRQSPIDTLLEHSSWVNRLAHALVGPDRAPDLTQDVWVSALRRPPEDQSNLRGWLRQVLVRGAHKTRRGDRRRHHREARAASAEVIDDPTERFSTHRDLIDHIGQLDDPWRRTILWRYFDELSLKEIAQREGVPVSTVNTRLRKAKELLRERLDGAHGGDRQAWMVALMPLARDWAPLAPLTPVALTGIGAPLLLMKLPQVIALVVAASVAAYFILPSDDVEPISPESLVQEDAIHAGDLKPLETPIAAKPSGLESERNQVTEAAPEPAVEAAEEEALGNLVGRVIDAEGKAMPNLEVWFAKDGDERLLGTSDANGEFPVDPERDIGLIEVRDEAYGNALSCRLPRGTRSGPTLVVARWIEIGGSVRNEAGEYIENAQLVLVQPNTLRALTGDIHGSSVSFEPRSRTDELGGYHFPQALAVEGASMLVQAHGYQDLEAEVPTHSTTSFEMTLQRLGEEQDSVIGQVVDGSGNGVSEAWVSLGFLSVQTDNEGNFQINTKQVTSGSKYERLIAVKAGHQPALLERPKNPTTEEAEPWPDFVELQLGDEPLEMRGRVVDATGAPIPGWKVWISDPTFFSSIDQTGVMVEGLAAGLPDTDDDEETPSRTWPWVATDEQGRFVLKGLLAKDYELRVHHEASMLLVKAGTYAAGDSNIEIVVDLDAVYGPVEGQVTDTSGTPIEGATVKASVLTYHAPHGEGGMLTWASDLPAATTDAKGRYRFERLPLLGVNFRVKHPDILPEELWLERGENGKPIGHEDWDEVDVQCESQFHVQVEISPSSAAKGSLQIQDADGERVLIQVFSATGYMTTHNYRFDSIKTEVLSISGKGAEIVLYDSESNEVARQSLNLVFGELNEVRF